MAKVLSQQEVDNLLKANVPPGTRVRLQQQKDAELDARVGACLRRILTPEFIASLKASPAYLRTPAIKLLPCPFCGSFPNFEVVEYGTCALIQCPQYCVERAFESADEAVAWWNTRSPR